MIRPVASCAVAALGRTPPSCSGDLIASTGYVVLWRNALQELADALRDGDLDSQVDFAAVSRQLTWANTDPTKSPAEPRPAAELQPVAAKPDLSHVCPGNRNNSLFDDFRFSACKYCRTFDSIEDFALAVLERVMAGRPCRSLRTLTRSRQAASPDR